MLAKGEFKVDLSPQKDDKAPVGRMLIDKSYKGKLEGTGVGQMISKRLEKGTAAYFAIEEFEGKLKNISGTMNIVQEAGKHFYELDYDM